jgi:proline iminopeptidase
MIVTVKGAELYYMTRGEGPACLVLSAIGTKPYERQMPPQLSDRLKLVFVDLRGGGRSTGDPSDLTFDVLADDLEAIRADLGVERIAVLGHSMLSMLAIEYGRRRPASVSHVITAGASPRGDMAWLAASAAAFFAEDASDDRKQVLRDNMSKLPADTPAYQAIYAQTPMRFFDPRFDARPLFAEAEVKPGLLQHIMGTLAPAWDVTAGASSLSVPIFLAHGRYDYVVPYVLWQGIAEKLPNATLQLFERSGHQPFFEEPDRFAAAVTSWMAGSSARTETAD